MSLDKFIFPDQFESIKFKLRFINCPNCKQIGFLILHGFLSGINEYEKLITKARRVFCSNRYSNKGCGKTYSIYFLPSLPKIKASTHPINQFLQGILNGDSIAQSFYRISNWCLVSLSTFKRYWIKFKLKISAIRQFLMDKISSTLKPPDNLVLENIYYINSQYPNSDNPIEAFILKSQIALF